MKFGHKFADAMANEGWPQTWVNSAIPYKGLKKVLKQIQAELEALGLDAATLTQLRQPNLDEEGRHRSGVAFQYNFKDQETLVPKLTFFVDFTDGEAVNALLTPATRNYLRVAAQERLGNSLDGQAETPPPSTPSSEEQVYFIKELHYSSSSVAAEVLENTQRVEIPLNFDSKFFELLQNDIVSLDKLQAKEQTILLDDIQALSRSLTRVAMPTRFPLFQHSDLYRWRELFELYLRANIFFSTNETDSGVRDYAKAKEQLQWFQTELGKRGIEAKFKLGESRLSLARFVKINMNLLLNLNFQEYNQNAIRKILKSKPPGRWVFSGDESSDDCPEFDKKTSLGAAKMFPNLFLAHTIMSGTIATAVCQQVTQDLIGIVPQVDDYTCPVCSDIHYRAVRLDCRHILCIRCTIVLQRVEYSRALCPICRSDTLLSATIDNLDLKMECYLERFFKKEVRSKQIQNQTARGREEFGINYKHPTEQSCIVQ
ncbi:ring-14 protein [Drepanopeziza brunnea f. sp. 'multigermtubi' MB_m1]|uniref:Ring-14 protein n=1 Tax=Marssonina brunnea f. sp. multigermtubi (strain MB_m1) TaxID=1072389 RepID=K1XR86_MARBU|nr:ring-14 protein [Drepanopeziza brunnea f. sp. 'multigermtubi' MB_m1]EKD15119.1 ring-14 protein [Drepanopeziza brunnea f. sp. 'multigermtubi' MB_m1]